MVDIASKFLNKVDELQKADALPNAEKVRQAVTKVVTEQLDAFAGAGNTANLGSVRRLELLYEDDAPTSERTEYGKQHPELDSYTFAIRMTPESDGWTKRAVDKLIDDDPKTVRQAATEVLEAAGCNIVAWSNEPLFGGQFAHVEHPEISHHFKADDFES